MANVYDVIVLGAGAMGSAAACSLAQKGQKVLLLEQFELDHQKGSSHGASRIIRYAYDHTNYIELMKTAYPMWNALESDSGEQLYTRTGGLDFGYQESPSLNRVIEALRLTSIPHKLLDAAEGNKRWPQFQFDPGMIIVYQEDSGILSASRTVRALIRLAEKQGAQTRFNTPVKKIIPHSNYVEIQTDTETFEAGHLVIAAGSWARGILAQLDLHLPLTPLKTQEIYFDSQHPEWFEPDRFPTFIAHIENEYGFMPYGMASNHGSGVKVGLHGGKRFNDPSEIDYLPDPDILHEVKRFTARHMSDVLELRSSRVCLYTMTPDEHFVIDSHPLYKHIVFGGGCSGHSFKFTPLIGTILADLASDGSTQHDISLFKANRFQSA